LPKDLEDKTNTEKVQICSKVWLEVIKREDPVIGSVLNKVKRVYEEYIKEIKDQAGHKVDEPVKPNVNEVKETNKKIENLYNEIKS
jgi:hypothetical protein